jgi:hypothetical protein
MTGIQGDTLFLRGDKIDTGKMQRSQLLLLERRQSLFR